MKQLFTIFLLMSHSFCHGQYIFDDYFCQYSGNFEPFEYNETNQSFRINVNETCDPNYNGTLWGFNLEDENDGFLGTTNFYHEFSDYMKGMPLHYLFKKNNGLTGSNDEGIFYGGHQLNHDEHKGRMLLLLNEDLYSEIDVILHQYKNVLIGDGWKVSMMLVAADTPVSTIKEDITTLYNETGDLRSVFIMGEVAIPYSGSNIYPDGHTEHRGAWMADVYYADLDGNWTDTNVNNTGSSYERHQNIPGDGKFDQSSCPSESELEIGRIYFENLPIFSESPAELYTRYLEKNIKYRTGGTPIDHQYVLQNNFNNDFPRLMLKDLWSISGTEKSGKKFDQTASVNFRTETSNSSYLFGFGTSFGSATSCNGIVTSSQFITDSLQVSFISLSGSYFGNWSYDNNLLSVACASASNTLAATWGLFNMPLTYLHSGQTYGFCQREAMSHARTSLIGFNGYYSNTVSNMLIGDPSLKIYITPQVETVSLDTDTPDAVNITWGDNSPTGVGYAVYRSNGIDGDFVRLNTDFITDLNYTDSQPEEGNNVYMVRAAQLDSSNVASFYTYSTGMIDSIHFEYADLDMDGFNSTEDCDDSNAMVNPDANEIPYNGLDDDCNPATLDDDLDQDGFGFMEDCDDTDAMINPDATDIANNGIDEDCDGGDLVSGVADISDAKVKVYPNPATDYLSIQMESPEFKSLEITIYNVLGEVLYKKEASFLSGQSLMEIDVQSYTNGVYWLEISTENGKRRQVESFIKL